MSLDESGRGAVPSVLVVDDEAVTRMMVRRVLEESGYRVFEAEDGESGLVLCTQLQPDLVLMDVRMPRMNGFDACRGIRTHEGTRHTPILMLTSLDDVVAVHMAFDAGASDFITKPINWALLSQRVRYALRARDIEWQLRESKGQLSEAHRIAQLEQWSVNVNGGEVTVTAALGEKLGLSGDSSHELRTVLRKFSAAERRSLMRFIRAVIQNEPDRDVEVRINTVSAGTIWLYLSARVLRSKDGRHLSMVGIAQDVTARRETQSKLNYLAHFEPLTGLPNRVLMRDRIAQAIVDASSGRDNFALVHIEVEDFHRFSASLGHSGGDQVLRAVTDRLSAIVQPGDTVSNLGGHAFAILLCRIENEHSVVRFVHQLLQAFGAPIEIDGRELLVTVCVGVSMHPGDGSDVDSVKLHAAAACARARELATPYQFFTPSMHARAATRLDREVELYRALERDEFELYFQPRVDLVSNNVTMVEALLRWNHPELGIVAPSEFIPILEDMGLILDVGRWVVQSACRTVRDLSVDVSVNVSPLEIRHPDFMSIIMSSIQDEEFPAERLELEITEQALMHDEDDAAAVLRALRAASVRISIDDYGAGYSSLRYLKQLPLDYLKIDRLFVAAMVSDPVSAAIVRSTVDLCHDLGVAVVGEGAEDFATISYLRKLECDSAQGFAIARPMPVAQLVDWLATPLSLSER